MSNYKCQCNRCSQRYRCWTRKKVPSCADLETWIEKAKIEWLDERKVLNNIGLSPYEAEYILKKLEEME
jgi:hypothetical protein